MLRIMDNTFKLKTKELEYLIDNKCKVFQINILTYLGVFNERMDDIKITLTSNPIDIRNLSLLKKEKISFKATSNTWEDSGEGIAEFNKNIGNKLEVSIKLVGEYTYEINTVIEATWVTLNEDIPFEELDKYLDINEIENIPFITNTNDKEIIQYMFKK